MTDKASLTDKIITLPQYFLPHHPLSRIMHKLTRSKVKWWKQLFIDQIVKSYGVDMSLAVRESTKDYDSFNEFFTRTLKPEARPVITDKNKLACPVDGAISQLGKIEDGDIFQAKGRSFTVQQLLACDEEICKRFEHGTFATIYLSPKDYHRIHIPVDGELEKMVHVPGRLFSVNPRTTRTVNGLFARNERVVTLFDTPVGSMALVMVGAIFVASIETVWAGEVTPPAGSQVRSWDYKNEKISLKKGDELGRFNMGSTVILLFEKDRIKWSPELSANSPVIMGQYLADKS
ncbi:MAG: archaetidylserine decarboxylase [Gammaproteobacteria bacterium]|nr:archaetidylserine decarboxylase [Gammaproteobacteria bacterium]MDH5694161.1 archaetidylserine decarboxylase [Gammaproteobacteria bacterium]